MSNRIINVRTNSRHGATDEARPPSPPIKAVRKALQVLRALNRLRIATLHDLHAETNIPKPTIVRILDTLILDGYVFRDNMCRGYRVRNQVRELDSGYAGIGEIIEASRLFAIALTNQIKWPVSIGTFDGDAMLVHFWTGTISPHATDASLVRRRPDLLSSAMGRSYLAFCGNSELEEILDQLRHKPDHDFTTDAERRLRSLLEDIRKSGYAMRAPETGPRRKTTLAMPLRRDSTVLASISVTFFTSAVADEQVQQQIVEPLKSTITNIENVMKFVEAREPLVS
jgi:IclR family mhp operon transcriptional activator